MLSFHPRLRVFPDGATRWRVRRRTQGYRARSGGVSPGGDAQSNLNSIDSSLRCSRAESSRRRARHKNCARRYPSYVDMSAHSDGWLAIAAQRREDRSASCLKRRNVSALLFNKAVISEAREVHDAYATGLRSHQ